MADYVSFYLFMVLYLQSRKGAFEAKHVTSEPAPESLLILGGYSYGSMIASHLPSLDTITALMKHKPNLATVNEIRARAEQLATFDRQEGAQLKKHLCIDGSEMSVPVVSLPVSDRRARQNSTNASRQSLSLKRRSRSSKRSRNRCEDSHQALDIAPDQVVSVTQQDSLNLQVCYLLISPLLSTVAGFTTMFSRLEFSMPGFECPSRRHRRQMELEQHASCAIYGDTDTFTSSKKLDRWAMSLQHNSKAAFTHFKIKDGGHFWHEANSEQELKRCLCTWLSGMESWTSS